MPEIEATVETEHQFPAAEIEQAVRDLLSQEGELQAQLHGNDGGSSSGAQSSAQQPTIDSLVVVEVLVEIESIVDFEISESIVKAGGYDSVEEAIQHIMPRLKKQWEKRHGEKADE